MEKIIDKNDLVGELEDELLRVFNAYRNRKAKKHFMEVTKDLKPQSCSVKIGWTSGKCIFFTCKFLKNGESEIFKEIVNGMPDKLQNLYFIYGLHPEKLEFERELFYEENEFLSLCFKLSKA